MIYDFQVMKKILEVKKDFQRLLDTPPKYWTERDLLLFVNKPIYIRDTILVDIRDNKVVVIIQDQEEEKDE